MTRSHLHTLAVALVALVAMVLASGLSRVLVVCSGGDDGRHVVEFVHEPSTCCDHDHSRGAPHHMPAAPAPTPDAPIAAADHHCEHGSFAFELTSPPRALHCTWAPPPMAVCSVLPELLAVADARGERAHVPATGPPRPDDWLHCRSTTLLLL